MLGPGVAPWVEEFDLTAVERVGRSLACSFTEGTRDASQCQIAEGCLATSGDGNDVIDVERCFLSRLGQAAVFAPLMRTFDDQASQVRRDLHRFSRRGGRSPARREAAAEKGGPPDSQVPPLRAARNR